MTSAPLHLCVIPAFSVEQGVMKSAPNAETAVVLTMGVMTRTLPQSGTGTKRENPFAEALEPVWNDHASSAFLCSAGEIGSMRRLNAVLCVSIAGSLSSLEDLKSDADFWEAEATTLLAGLPGPGQRGRRGGAWLSAEERAGMLEVKIIPRGKPMMSFSGGDGFVGGLVDNEKTFAGALFWWSHVADLLGCEPDSISLEESPRCQHHAIVVEKPVGIGTTTVIVGASVLLGLLLALLA